jgi:hypothetical protein
MRSLRTILALLASVGCGTPGAPQPPSLNIPKPISDLKAARKADTVTLSWTAPKQTTDGSLFRHTGKIIVRRALSSAESGSNVGEKPLEPTQKKQRPPAETWSESIRDLLRSDSGDFAIYTVEALNGAGKSGGPSNQVAVPLVLTAPTPKDVQLKVVPQGVSISWGWMEPPETHSSLAVRYVYRVMRRLRGPNQRPVVARQLDAGSGAALVVDPGIEWGKAYEYWVTPVTIWQKDDQQKGEVEGDDSSVATIDAQDVFPPAAPSGLQAVFSQVGTKSFIDLTWNPNTEADLAGYNVYRRTQESEFIKINRDLVKTPAFRDGDVLPGMKYFYSVTAIDLRNNESSRSEEATETVPK